MGKELKRILRITGDFEQNYEWEEPGFEAYVAVNTKGTFRGVCKELYDCKKEYSQRYMAGLINEKGISFVKLSNNSRLEPIIYLSDLHDISEWGKNGWWGTPGASWGGVYVWGEGQARLKVDELPYDYKHWSKLWSYSQNIDYRIPQNKFIKEVSRILEEKALYRSLIDSAVHLFEEEEKNSPLPTDLGIIKLL